MATRPGLTIPPPAGPRGRLLASVRLILLKLLAPMLGRFLQANDEMMQQLGAVSSRIDEAHRRLDRLTEETAAANALAWEQIALSRRLATIEQRLDEQREAEPASAADSMPTR